MKQSYKEAKHEIGLKKSLPDSEIDKIDKVQFEFLREVAMREMKSVRLPNFGIFLIKEKAKNIGKFIRKF